MNQNHLLGATSPYLLQHAGNPVDWWPWCDEALALARQLDRPILLSIGYSACHWCHVMAHESFEDEQTAALMNELFVNIKVDREERPDLDKIYQNAHHLLAQRAGGWPLTVFLMPDDQTPFFAGTYFPPEPRHGLIAFGDLLQRIHNAYHEQRDAIREQNASLRQALHRLQPSAASDTSLDDKPVTDAIAQFRQNFDGHHGGFGAAPKFPHPDNLEFLLHHDAGRPMALFTLQQMANGGVNDLIGGGFYRYSVDQQWMIPHFEKMLYDNGALLSVYAAAWQMDQRRPLFKHVCERTADWVVREMQHADGGYYASLDADSEGEEGRYYVWDRAAVAELLDESTYDIFARRFGLDRAANFEGRWHLHTFVETAQLTGESGLSAGQVRKALLAARNRLLAERATRIRPGCDDKILTSWNALMIKGMARAGRLLGHPEWIHSAEQAMDFLRRVHWQGNRLCATSRNGEAQLNAYLDDYAYLIDALLELLQARWNTHDLTFATELADALLSHFEDRAAGGFFFTSDDHETLLQRLKSFTDDAIPAGNGVAADALQRLALLVGSPAYTATAERTLRSGWQSVTDMPFAHTAMLQALERFLGPGDSIILRGPAPEIATWQQRLNEAVPSGLQSFAIPADAPDLPPALAAKAAPATGVLAYRCVGTHCAPPIDDLDALIKALQE